MSYLDEMAFTSASTTKIPSSWDFPQNISTVFPKSDPDRLSGEGNYHVWAVRMENAFEVCGLLDVVSGAMPRPPPGDVNDAVWLKMNASARTVIVQCINSSLVMEVSHFRDAKDIWTMFRAQYARTGAGSIVYWFSCLSNPMQPTDDVSAHIMAFQDAYRHLEKSKFVIPESCAAGQLLSTLYRDPRDPRSWGHFIEGMRLAETTTLSSVVNLLLEEKLRRSSANMTVETAVAAQSCGDIPPNGEWYRNPERGGHVYEEYWNTGGGKEGQQPEREQKRRKRGKGQRGRGEVGARGRGGRGEAVARGQRGGGEVGGRGRGGRGEAGGGGRGRGRGGRGEAGGRGQRGRGEVGGRGQRGGGEVGGRGRGGRGEVGGEVGQTLGKRARESSPYR